MTRKRGRPPGSGKKSATARFRPASRNGTGHTLIPKEQLANEIAAIVRYRHLTQTEAAALVGDAPSQLSLLLSGKLRGFSTERLLRMLLRLGRNVEMVVRPSPGFRAGKFRLTLSSA